MTVLDLSIIIPAYNEEALIVNTLESLRSYMTARPEQYEIIVVDDGSHDKTVPFIEEWQKKSGTGSRLLINQKNMGKGFSIRRGVMESRGQYVIFIDADLPYELYAIDDFLKALKNGNDLAVGSRVLPGSEVKGVPAYRYVAGQIFSLMVQAVLFTGLPDTQCGFKSFKSEAAREIFRRVSIDGFGFDVEMLFVARKLKFAIQPVAVHMIEHRQRSRVRLVNDSLKMFLNLFMVRWMDWQGKYD
ncbi:MAG: glycosyltransferase [Anaerolineae bacterium]|nr:glycosyltransferase [Anaerolineae bacterium]MCI0607916.1 glycosyltransferase [Anaerolineae bacterium]